jgi:ADP-ribose pyrophosphatase YjhB (NUDIX family)
MVVKENLYRLLGKTAGGCFNLLNILLRGNLPPFGSVCVVVEEQGRYLLLVQSHGKVCLPGGFMRWMEDPLETARRECAEETGLQVRVRDFIGCFSCPSDHAMRMSTLTMVYSTQIAGGRLRRRAEGKPVWCTEAEALERLELRYRRFLEAYLRFYQQTQASTTNQAVEPAPISERV